MQIGRAGRDGAHGPQRGHERDGDDGERHQHLDEGEAPVCSPARPAGQARGPTENGGLQEKGHRSETKRPARGASRGGRDELLRRRLALHLEDAQPVGVYLDGTRIAREDHAKGWFDHVTSEFQHIRTVRLLHTYPSGAFSLMSAQMCVIFDGMPLPVLEDDETVTVSGVLETRRT